MIGPSSSHTAGAARLGRIAGALLGQPPIRAEILLHGSFAKTYKGHGTDKALVAGILGMGTDDERIRFSLDEAKKAGLLVSITPGEIDGAHPNTALITLTGRDGSVISLQGSSIGGGNILVTRVNGMDVSFTGERTAFLVLHRDAPGTIAAVTELLAEWDINICNFRLSRKEKGGEAVMTIEVDGNPAEDLNTKLQSLPNIFTSTMLRAQS